MDNWIRVVDKMPPIGESVLIYRRFAIRHGVDVTNNQFIEQQIDWITNGIWDGKQWTYDGYPTYDVTHWMPLPEPPKEER